MLAGGAVVAGRAAALELVLGPAPGDALAAVGARRRGAGVALGAHLHGRGPVAQERRLGRRQKQLVAHGLRGDAAGDARLHEVPLHPRGQPTEVAVAVQLVCSESTKNQCPI